MGVSPFSLQRASGTSPMPPTLPGDRSAVVKPLTCPVVATTSAALDMGPLFRPPRRNLLILALRVTGPTRGPAASPSLQRFEIARIASVRDRATAAPIRPRRPMSWRTRAPVNSGHGTPPLAPQRPTEPWRSRQARQLDLQRVLRRAIVPDWTATRRFLILSSWVGKHGR